MSDKELNIYEIMPDQVDRVKPLLSPDAAQMIKNWGAMGVVAVEENIICGAICGRITDDDDLEIVSLYVHPDYRRQNVASTLLLEYSEAMNELADGMLRSVYMGYTDDIYGIEGFVTKVGFETESVKTELGETMGSYYFTVGDAVASPALKANDADKSSRTEILTGDIEEPFANKLFRTLRDNNVDYVNEDDIMQCEREVSLIAYEDDGNICGCLLFNKDEEGNLVLSQLFVSPRHPKFTIEAFGTAAKALGEHYSHDTRVKVPAVSDSSIRLLNKLLGNCLTCVPYKQARAQMPL